jgi:hypothetical protein
LNHTFSPDGLCLRPLPKDSIQTPLIASSTLLLTPLNSPLLFPLILWYDGEQCEPISERVNAPQSNGKVVASQYLSNLSRTAASIDPYQADAPYSVIAEKPK